MCRQRRSMVSCTPQRVPHCEHAKCSPRTCSSRSSKLLGSPSKRHSTTRHCCPSPSAVVKSSSGVMALANCELAFAQIATEKSSKRLFLRKSDRHPLLNLEQRSRSKRNKWRGPPSAAREGSSPFMPDWFLSVAEGSAYRCDEPKTLLTSLPISHTRQRRAKYKDRCFALKVFTGLFAICLPMVAKAEEKNLTKISIG